MNLIPGTVDLMRKVSQEELIEAVRAVMPEMSLEAQTRLFLKLSEKVERRG